jgi:PPOX class probable F420-dependent enzyme
MKLNEAARELIGDGADATLVTLNPDGSPQVTVVWVGLRSTPDGDELVSAHLGEHKKVRNIRRDPRVGVTIVSTQDPGKAMRPYLAIEGTAWIEEGGAPELLKTLAQALADPTTFPPEGAPPGFVTHIRIDKVGGIGPWSS